MLPFGNMIFRLLRNDMQPLMRLHDMIFAFMRRSAYHAAKPHIMTKSYHSPAGEYHCIAFRDASCSKRYARR